MKLKKQDSAYPLLATLKKLGRPLTRENYLVIDGWDNPKPELTAEEELDLPPQFRRSSRSSKGRKGKETSEVDQHPACSFSPVSGHYALPAIREWGVMPILRTPIPVESS